VIGPHGDYDFAQEALWFAIKYALWLQKFALEDTAVKYLATTMNEYTQATESVLKAALRALVKHNDSWKNLDRAIRNTVCIDGRIGCDRTPH